MNVVRRQLSEDELAKRLAAISLKLDTPEKHDVEVATPEGSVTPAGSPLKEDEGSPKAMDVDEDVEGGVGDGTPVEEDDDDDL